MAKAKKKSTRSRTSLTPPPPPTPFEVERRDWEAQQWRRGRYDWLNRDRSNDAAEHEARIRHKEQLKGLREIREAVLSGRDPFAEDQPPPVEPQKPTELEGGGKPFRRTCQVLREKVYPPDGKAPGHLSIKAIWAEVCNKWREVFPKEKLPSEDTVGRAVKSLGRS